jgi:ribosomal protein S18 acetylase RimI-like enzyme
MSISYREMAIADYQKVYNLWGKTEGIGLSDTDEKENIARFLDRNPGTSFVANDGNLLVGALLCGNDGRRGYVHHLAVRESHRRLGIGSQLIKCCLVKLASMNIHKCHLFVFVDNRDAISFWESIGWEKRGELLLMSKYT